MSIENSVVAIYRQHNDAELAVKELQRGGIDMRKLSIAGKGYHTEEQVVGYYNTGDRMKYWGKVGYLRPSVPKELNIVLYPNLSSTTI